MSAKLEEYLKRRRDELDVESPGDDTVWHAVRGRLGRRDMNLTIMLIRIRNIAAVIIILFSLGYIANDIINGRVRNRKPTLSSISAELGRRETEYRILVSFRTREVSSFSGSQDVIIRQLFEELKNLDVMYDEAMKDLKELGPDEKVVNTIFNTYEQKIRLLELIILETNKINSHENNGKVIL